MEQKTILILGGYGGAGFPIARRLLQETGVRLILSGRTLEKAKQAASQLNAEFPGGRVLPRHTDVSDAKNLGTSFGGTDMVLVCSPTSQYAEQVARAALSAGIDYLDIHYPQKVVPALKSLEPSIREANRCFITQAGCHPGLPAALVRYAASHFDHLKRAIIGMTMNFPSLGSSDSVLELVEDISEYQAEAFYGGHWHMANYKDATKIDFGPGFGIRTCVPMMLEEMRTLPAQFQLEETGTYVSGFNWFVDWLVFPLAAILGKIRRGLGSPLLVSFMIWGIKAFSRPPFGMVFKLEAHGEKDGKSYYLEVMARHEDGYQFTAIPVVACLLQYLEGSIVRPGLWMMGQWVDPARLLKDMERMGIEIRVSLEKEKGT